MRRFACHGKITLIYKTKIMSLLTSLKPILCIQELSPFGYTPLSVCLKFSPLSLHVLKYLVFKKKKFINKQYIVKKIYTIYRKDPVTWTNGQNNFEATCVSFTTFKTNLEKCYIIIYYLFPRPYCCELGMTHNINCQFKKIMMIGKNYSVSLYFIFTIMMERKC